MEEKSRIIKHHRFGDFMKMFSEMQVSGNFNYRALHLRIKAIDNTISYDSVYAFFRKFVDSGSARELIHRAELREKMKVIANDALDEVIKNPKKLPLHMKIRLGREATSEELREIAIILADKNKKKELDFMESLLDKARYGEVIEMEDDSKPYLERKTENQALPNPD